MGIFAKEPLAGRVKTRLSPPLSGEEAAAFYRVALAETVERLAGGPFEVRLFYSGAESFFRENFPGVALTPQGEGDLGARMERALQGLLGAGCAAAVLVGSDSPDLPLSLVEEAFAALAAAEVVTAPAPDGGYVLIGERTHCPQLFSAMPWSSAAVLEETRRRVRAAGLSYRELASWEDVDDLASLRRLVERSPGSDAARHARLHLARHLEAADS